LDHQKAVTIYSAQNSCCKFGFYSFKINACDLLLFAFDLILSFLPH